MTVAPFATDGGAALSAFFTIASASLLPFCAAAAAGPRQKPAMVIRRANAHGLDGVLVDMAFLLAGKERGWLPS
jgi:hypothetical protein